MKLGSNNLVPGVGRLCLAAAVLSGTAALHACRTASSERTIAVVSKSTGSDLWLQLHDGVQGEADRLHETVQWAAPESEADYTQQADMVDDAVRRHVDGILLSPTHQMVLASAVRRAREAGIPVVIVDAPIALPSDQYVAYVGSSDVEIGSLAADRAAQVLHGKGSVGMIGVSPTLEGSSLREHSFRERLRQQSPQVRIVAMAYGVSDWGRSTEAVRDMVEHHPEIDLIFASDPFGTVGAATELHNRRHRPLLIGVDSEGTRIAAVDRGEIDSLVIEDMAGIGRAAMQTLHASMQGKPYRAIVERAVTLHVRRDAPTAPQSGILPSATHGRQDVATK